MTGKKTFLPIVTVALILALTACGVSADKISAAEEARSRLIEAKNTAEETYLDVSDESLKGQLSDLSGQVSEIEALEFGKMKEEDIDGLIPKLEELTGKYETLQGNLSSTLKTETETRAEKEKHTEVSVYFVNKTGLNLTEIKLHDLTRDAYSDNYIGEGVTLGNGYTLMGVVLDFYAGSSQWEFVVTDEADTDHILSCGDLKGEIDNGSPVILTYDSKTGTGTAGSGVAKEESGTESAAEASSENSGN